MEIEKIDLDRIDDAMAIERACNPQAGHRDDYIRRITRRGGVYVAYEDAKPIGFIFLDRDLFLHNPFVSMMYVLPELRKRGIGAAMLAHVEAQIEEDWLFVAPRITNTSYIHMLHRLGYDLCGSISHLHNEPPIMIMGKDIKGSPGSR